ncbi:AMP-binding protein [Nakamurella sp. YIM 132087]|uniref:AMP-binding protein n=1 Tax=Nakamurella alba TaxID=2665158 RepID=A0A7K1FRF5_9ACTN|nr:AMP-binding protein [Nakamurella alba]MTD15949.1 AMP-binding protein [Nakamurella alba]
MQRPDYGLGRLISRSARLYPDLPCLVDDTGAGRSFAEVDDRVARLANGLRGIGIGRASRVGVLSIDTPGYVELILACFAVGATLVPLNYRLTADELRYIDERAALHVLFVSERYRAIATALRDGDPPLQILDLADDLEQLITAGGPERSWADLADDDILCIMFTSGTTGRPKGVLQSHRMLKSVYLQMWECLPRPGDVRYTASPLFHAAGFFVLLGQIAMGSASMIVDQFRPEVTARAIGSGLLTGCFLVPTMIAAVLDHAAETGLDIGSDRLRQLLYGGAPMPTALLRRALDRWPHCDFWNMYGSGTESNSQTYLRPTDHRRALAGEEHLLATVGQAVTGVDLRIVDDAGREVPDGVVGRIAARTDVVMSGYLDDPERTAEALQDGWFYSGDLGSFGPNGYLTLAGRGRDMIIRGGENIYVAEIESVLAAQPGVSDAAVVGRADERWGQVPVAWVEATGEPAPTEQALRQRCREVLAAYKVPVTITVVKSLPRNATGKVVKDLLVT